MTDNTRALLEQALASMVRAELIYGQPNQAIQEAIRAELAKPVGAEPVACVVETESGVMVWPIADYNEASTYCDDDESPSLLYLHPPTPAWHDAPTCPGLWVLDDGTALVLESGTLPKAFDGLRWYGPIPEDAKAEEKNHERP